MIKKANRELWADESGAAYVEFLLAFIPLFTLFMGMAQMAFMYEPVDPETVARCVLRRH